ncbi:MAG: holo-ACP synthase [Saccharofermentans sp.]|nr:holo-ACP synthase [Saccharofermentans sp.]
MKVRCGIDIVDITRFVKNLEDGNTAFFVKCFTEDEIAYCNSSQDLKKKAERFAARWAAKEAVGKALGTGLLSEGVGMHDIEVVKDQRGTPGIKLYGGALLHADDIGMSSVSISLSHDGGMAAAYCVMLVEKD